MCFSDERFAYGPFPPHYVPRQYLENYVALHKLDKHLVLNTTVEDLSKIPSSQPGVSLDRWKLTLRKHDALRSVDIWWTEIFDAVVIANGHYAVPFIPHVEGLEEYQKRFPDRVVHSKHYRSPTVYSGLKVLTIGNSASGFDIFNELTQTARLPVYSSRRSKGPAEGDKPPPGIRWKPVITRYYLDGTIEFEDGSILGPDDVDKIIYCTGYRPSFPFWNIKNNGRPLYDYENGKLINIFWHTFFYDLPSLALVGIQKGLTFRSFEYQAVALARLFTKRNVFPLPPVEEQRKWELDRLELVKVTGQKYHDLQSQPGPLGKETFDFFGYLYRFAGLGTLKGDGRIPPVLSQEVLDALKNLHKYPKPGQSSSDKEGLEHTSESSNTTELKDDHATKEWVLVEREM
ncbi:Thiol-specific monooxygenase [Cytospora mali]|uniref:Thiol-specific monooxygenase n=1 Tax=Cytospora mali TaxID=578113 RepID=A0A194VBV2_CYTMA|nr:Thiol-specific monooxygenase [Valsa mali var. pyri (nom. inval.)]